MRGDDGFLRAYSFKNNYNGDRIIGEVGKKWEMLDTSIKVHACCRFAAPIIDCTLDIARKNDISADKIKEIKASSSTIIIEAITKPTDRKINPKTIVDAQFSLPYCVSVAVIRKKAFVEEFTEKSIKNRKILSLIPKVKWAIDPKDDENYPKYYSATVKIIMKNGKEYQSKVNYPKGDPENPVTKEELEQKFYELSYKIIGDKKVKEITKIVWDLENLRSLRNLTKLLRTENRNRLWSKSKIGKERTND